MTVTINFTRVIFYHFKAFESFQLHLRHFNILVGPNNSGKSTVLTAFRILSAGMRRARKRKPEILPGPSCDTYGYRIDLGEISVAEENVFYNYDDSEPAQVSFKLSNKNNLTLFFPSQGICFLFAEDPDKNIDTPALFRSRFNCPIGFVPILGPVDHNERLFEKEAARLALFNYRAARNFRNIWYHYNEKFDSFKTLLRETWPGMDIEPPQIDMSSGKPILHMFCPEERIPRELFWAGFGFQVWCQMLTHVIQSSESAIFLIDEPDIYLHSDLQRQLLGLLRDLGPDILLATHSTEIISEAETDDIILVDKKRKMARRIKDPSELIEVFSSLGSNLNPTLTQLAKTRHAVFVEGKDFQILGKFARKLGFLEVGNRSSFSVIPVEGFSPDRIRSLKKGIETTLGFSVATAAILDKDFRCTNECKDISEKCDEFCDYVKILGCKEIENYLLVPEAIDRAASRRVLDCAKRTGNECSYTDNILTFLVEYSDNNQSYVMSQYLAKQRQFTRRIFPHHDEATSNQAALEDFASNWNDVGRRLELIPGKDALSSVNNYLQENHQISITPTAIINAMQTEEIPTEVKDLCKKLSEFANS